MTTKQTNESLGQRMSRISRAFEIQFNPPQQMNVWVMEAYDDFVIAGDYGPTAGSGGMQAFYKVTYQEADGAVQFATRDQWIIVEREEKWVEKVKELHRHDTQNVAQRVFEAITGSLKAGARHSKNDLGDMQTLHDIAIRQGAVCPVVKAGFFTKKETDGRVRWVLMTTTAFEDRDKEVISEKALVQDVERADKDGEYGPLLWWHVPGAELGTTDYNALEGKVLIESGVFHNAAVGERIKEAAHGLGASPGFFHPITEPDGEGVFYNIRRFERSLLPIEAASNPMTALPLVFKETSMDKTKEAALRELLGGDEALLQDVLSRADSTQKAAENQGVRTKATAAADDEKPKEDDDDKKKKLPDEFEEMIKKMVDQKMADVTTGVNELKTLLQGRATKDVALETTLAEIRTTQLGVQTSLETAVKQQRELDAKVAELAGEKPKGLLKEGFRASTDPSTITENPALKAARPSADPLLSMIDRMDGVAPL